jgi:hypothetical protein
VNQWNLSIQRQIGQAWMASVNYAGNSTIHFWTLQQLNPSVYIPGSSTTANTAARRRLTLKNAQEGAYYAGLTQTGRNGKLQRSGLVSNNAVNLRRRDGLCQNRTADEKQADQNRS